MITVYRVENSEGKGPYNVCYSNLTEEGREIIRMGDYLRRSHNCSKNHPPPYRDLGTTDLNGRIFGFESLNQLKMWFDNKEIKLMAKNGFNIVEIMVDEATVLYGKKQIAFFKQVI